MEKFLEILHVGGRGDIGLSDILWSKVKNEANLTLFEADNSLTQAGLAEEVLPGIKVIPKCLSNFIGKADFYLNADGCSSSLFKPNPKMLDCCFPNRWGDHTKLNRTIKVDVTTINQLLDEGTIMSPNFIGLDAQGSEYNIMLGGNQVFERDLVGIISEMEFREIYENQPFFAEQDTFLRKHRFSIHDMYGWQYWSYIKYFDGTGFPLCTEALYLRDFEYFSEKNEDINKKLMNLSKLIVVAVAYNKFCYGHMILKHIKSAWRNDWNIFLDNSSYDCLKQVVKTIEDIAIKRNLE